MGIEGTRGLPPESQPDLEDQIRAAARVFHYPDTPDIARVLKNRRGWPAVRSPYLPRRVWAVAILIAVIAGLAAVPQVRAAVLDWIRLGAVRIYLVQPTLSPMPSNAPTPPPTQTLHPSLLDLAGETSLAQAKLKSGFDIRLPTYPPGLGQPDRVFLQDLDGPAVVLAWVDKTNPDQATLSLFELSPGSSGLEKIAPRLIQETRVNGVRALWTEGDHVIHLRDGDMDFRSLVTGNTLIWVDGGVTYRLETSLPLEEAVRIAESLQ